MTERPKWDAGPGEHPDEGTIHAWLDDALDAASAARVEAHVRGCAACSTLTAEARGLIAGASRVVTALDDAPAGTRPTWAQSQGGGSSAAPSAAIGPAAADRSLWRRLRVTPVRAAIAATLIVAAGLTLTHQRAAKESVVATTMPAGHLEPRFDTSGGVTTAAPSVSQPHKDATLDSAVARNLSIAQGRPSIEAARSPAIPQAPVPGAPPIEDAPVAMSERRVAAGRAAVQAQRETTAVAADKVRVRDDVTGAVATRAAAEVAAQVPARRAMSNSAPSSAGAVASMSQAYADASARSCYLLESTHGGATWGEQPLPLVVVVDSGPGLGTRNAALRSAATGTEVRATWARNSRDSVAITLQRVGMIGTIALGPDAGGRTGLAASSEIAASRMATTLPADAAERARTKLAAPSVAPAPRAEPGASPQRLPSAASVPVTLRPTPCPIR